LKVVNQLFYQAAISLYFSFGRIKQFAFLLCQKFFLRSIPRERPVSIFSRNTITFVLFLLL